MLGKLIAYTLGQRLMVLLLVTVATSLGAWAYTELPIDAFPDISSPQVQVIVKAPGMTPVEVEERITRPIEIEARGIPRQSVLRSLTKYALAVITIDFEEGTDIYWARQQVAERIGQVLADLPAGVSGGLAPITMPLSDVYMFLVEGKGFSPRQLRSILDWEIRPRLLSAGGVADVNSLGGEVRSIHVVAKPDALQSFNLSIHDISEALKKNNQNVGGDRFSKHDEILLIRTLGQIKTIKDIQNIPVATRNGVPIRISDLATVQEGPLTRFGGVTRHGEGEAVQGLVLNRRGANARDTVQNVKASLEEIKKSLPEGVEIVPFYDRTDLVTRAVSNVENALLQAVILVLFVLLVFLGNLRAAITVGMILPLTVFVTFLLMRFFELSANLMSLGGLAIAIGLLVDSAVVMVENTVGHLTDPNSQKTKLQRVLDSAVEVSVPIVSAVVIIVVTLLPIATLQGVEGKLFAPLALTIIFALLVSLVLSLTAIPVLSSLIISEKATKESAFMLLLSKAYKPSLRFAIQHRKATLAVSITALILAGILSIFIGREFLPYLDEGTIVIQTEKLPTISLERSLEIDSDIQKALMAVPEVTGVVARAGADELRLDPMGLNESDVFLQTKPRSEWGGKSVEELLNTLRDVLDTFPGLGYGFTQPIDMRVSEMLTGVRAAVAVKVRGAELDMLEEKAQAIETIISNTPGAVDVMRAPLGGQRYLNIEMRYEAMSRAGVSVEDVNTLVATAIAGETPTEVIEGNKRVPVLLRYPLEYRSSVEAINNLKINTPTGAKMRLGDLTSISLVDGPVQIQREDGERQVVIQVNVNGRDVVGFVDEIKEAIIQKAGLPPGYYVNFGGQFENQQRASGHLMLVVPVALALVLLLLFITFGSLKQAVLILANIPLALIGGVVILFASGLYLSVPASIGFIALFGIAIQNGVVLVTYFNQLRERGATLTDAVTTGAEKRLRPVLMTAILTVLGLMPLILSTGPGSEIQRPLALVVVGGVITSTLLTLILLPVLYLWVEEES
ncbi:efflux RND transporter permease subunit [Myxococcota bacterium]|nr:efflux RND transporter permease subunit [Myxococcota bacterium]